jgi:hypothetical protein
MPMKYLLATILLAVLSAWLYHVVSEPSTYEECVLNNVATAQTDVAAHLVRNTCRTKFPVAPPAKRIYRVLGPDNHEYKFEGPDDATEAEQLEFALGLYDQRQKTEKEPAARIQKGGFGGDAAPSTGAAGRAKELGFRVKPQ